MKRRAQIRVALRMPVEMNQALERVTRQRLTNPSEYIRQALLARLIQDGVVEPPPAFEPIRLQQTAA